MKAHVFQIFSYLSGLFTASSYYLQKNELCRLLILFVVGSLFTIGISYLVQNTVFSVLNRIVILLFLFDPYVG